VERLDVRVTVHDSRCTGHGRCYSLSPQIFGSDDQGFVVPRGESIAIDAEHEDAARLAVASCPEAAIELLAD
jgi:ferredoxin